MTEILLTGLLNLKTNKNKQTLSLQPTKTLSPGLQVTDVPAIPKPYESRAQTVKIKMKVFIVMYFFHSPIS